VIVHELGIVVVVGGRVVVVVGGRVVVGGVSLEVVDCSVVEMGRRTELIAAPSVNLRSRLIESGRSLGLPK
jgi:hypothetical protein